MSRRVSTDSNRRTIFLDVFFKLFKLNLAVPVRWGLWPVWSRRTITESTLLESKMKACQPRPLCWIWMSYLSKVMTRGLRWFLLRLDDLSGLGVEVEWRISGSDKVWPWSETAALGWSGKCDVTRINIWVRAELLPGNPTVVGYEVSACKTWHKEPFWNGHRFKRPGFVFSPL